MQLGVDFMEGRKPENPEKNLRSTGEINYDNSIHIFIMHLPLILTWLAFFCLTSLSLCLLIISFTRFFVYFLFLYDEGPTLGTLDFTVCIGSTPTFSFFNSYIYFTYSAHYVYLTKITSLCMPCECLYLNGYPSYHININIYIITRISRHDYMF